MVEVVLILKATIKLFFEPSLTFLPIVNLFLVKSLL